MVWMVEKSEKIEWNGMGGMSGPNMKVNFFFIINPKKEGGNDTLVPSAIVPCIKMHVTSCYSKIK